MSDRTRHDEYLDAAYNELYRSVAAERDEARTALDQVRREKEQLTDALREIIDLGPGLRTAPIARAALASVRQPVLEGKDQ